MGVERSVQDREAVVFGDLRVGGGVVVSGQFACDL